MPKNSQIVPITDQQTLADVAKAALQQGGNVVVIVADSQINKPNDPPLVETIPSPTYQTQSEGNYIEWGVLGFIGVCLGMFVILIGLAAVNSSSR